MEKPQSLPAGIYLQRSLKQKDLKPLFKPKYNLSAKNPDVNGSFL